MKILVAEDLLHANDEAAGMNKKLLEMHHLPCVNLISGPGAGKTALLEETINTLGKELKMAVIEGDLYTERDAKRLEERGVEVVQINTKGACHLDAAIVGRAMESLALDSLDLLFIENVGNLVCPAEFDLGETAKVVVLSVSEGGDKPLKYPLAFVESQAAVVSKLDLLPYCDLNLKQLEEEIHSINIDIEIMPLSSKSGEGMEQWYSWLKKMVRERKSVTA